MRWEVRLIMKMIIPTLMLTVLLAGALSLAPVIAGPPAWVTKTVVDLDDSNAVKYGIAILNDNPEDDETFEVEVEVEESNLAEGLYDVVVDGTTFTDAIYIDANGDGEVTIYSTTLPDLSAVGEVTVAPGDANELNSDSEDRPWVKGPGPK
jgi:hypothetical protein